MKIKEITMTIVKNLGNYESARAAVTYTVDPATTSTAMAMATAKDEIESAFNKLYGESSTYVEKTPLLPNTAVYEAVKIALSTGRMSKEDLVEKYEYTSDVFESLVTK